MELSHLKRYMTAITRATPTRTASRMRKPVDFTEFCSRMAVQPKPRKKFTKLRKVYRLAPLSMFDRSDPSMEVSTSMSKSVLSASAPRKVITVWMMKMRVAVRVTPHRSFMTGLKSAHQVAIISDTN